MLYFGFDNKTSQLAFVGGEDAREKCNKERFEQRLPFYTFHCSSSISSDFRCYQSLAERAIYLTGDLYVTTDSGPRCWPRYDVVRAPKVGDLASYAFNGDAYPDGEVVSVSKSLQVKTSGGNTYRRRRNTGTWLQTGGTWPLVRGHYNERNLEF